MLIQYEKRKTSKTRSHGGRSGSVGNKRQQNERAGMANSMACKWKAGMTMTAADWNEKRNMT